MADSKRTPLHDTHVAQGARMVSFGGWRMPVEYTGISSEHRAVRTAVGLFDVSHMGEFRVRGPGAGAFLQHATTNDVYRLSDGQAQYTIMAGDDGTVIDDLLVYRIAQDHFLMVVNAATTESDFRWLAEHAGPDVELENVSDETALLALQGPRVEAMLQPLTPADLSGMAPFSFAQSQVGDARGLLARTGYTGEDGFEFYFSQSDATRVWKTLLDAGQSFDILPAGLGARNTLRLEAGLLLYGNDIHRGTTPLEAGLDRIVKLDKGDFIGRDALLEQKQAGLRRKLVGFQMLGPEIARDGYTVLVNGEPVGHVTSGGPGITLKKNIGLVYLPVENAARNTRFQVQVRKRLGDAEVIDTPFYKRRRSV